MGEGFERRTVEVGKDRSVALDAQGDEFGNVFFEKIELGVIVKALVERGAIDGGDFVAALEEFFRHPAGARAEFEPRGADGG